MTLKRFFNTKNIKIMELELKHLSPYLPYKLNYFIDFEDGDVAVYEMIGMFNDSGEIYLDGYETNLDSKTCKPILRPLSDLQKEIDLEIEGLFIIGGERFRDWQDVCLESLNYEKFSWFLEHHYDVFGLIEKGLAIDKNTIKK